MWYFEENCIGGDERLWYAATPPSPGAEPPAPGDMVKLRRGAEHDYSGATRTWFPEQILTFSAWQADWKWDRRHAGLEAARASTPSDLDWGGDPVLDPWF